MTISSDQAFDKIMHLPEEKLLKICSESYKDQYGFCGSHLNDYSFVELANWWINHNRWSLSKQIWVSTLSEEI